MNILSKYTFTICLFFVFHGLVAQTTVPVERTDTLHYVFMFPINSFTIEPEWRGNAEEIHRIDSIAYFFQNKNYDIISIDIVASASFDGGRRINDQLSARRAMAVQDFLFERFRFSEQTSINIRYIGADWRDLQNFILQDDTISADERTQLLEIINDNSLSYDEKEARIRQLNQGATFNHLMRYALDLFRRANMRIIVRYKEEVKEEVIEPQPEDPEPVVPKEPEPKPVVPEYLPEPPPVAFWALKTNLVYLGAGVLNAGVEFPIGNRFSLDIPIIYSPYTIASNWRLRTLGIQPEVRWWTNQTMKGHFFGLHSHLVYYNVSTNRHNRYQDRDGRTPLWGFGLSYGYALHLNGRWNMEFTIGGGYARLDYDIFYNVPNGALRGGGTRNYWGITRASINLIYQFNIR